MSTNRRAVVSGLAAATVAGPTSAERPQTPKTLSLITKQLHITLESASGWGVGIRDRASGQVLSLAGKSPLFELVLAEASGEQLKLSAPVTGPVKISAHRVGRRKMLRLEFVAIGGRNIAVTCTIAEREDGGAAFQAEIINHTGSPLRALRYPVITLNPRPSSDDDDSDQDTFLAMPMSQLHVLLRNPHQWLPSPRQGQASSTEPCQALSTQFYAYYANDAGLYCAAHDPTGCAKGLGSERIEGFARLYWSHYLPEKTFGTQRLGYEIVVSTFRGDWYAAADLYKIWARRQVWCRRTLRQRSDIAKWIKQGSVWLTLDDDFQQSDRRSRYFGASLADLTDRWMALTPHPPVLHFQWTEKYDAGAQFLDSKPFFPSDVAYRTSLASEKKKGVRAVVTLAGYVLTIAQARNGRAPRAHDERARFASEARSWAVRDEKSKITPWRSASNPGRTNVWLCSAAAPTHRFLNDLAKRYAEVGFSLCQLGQALGEDEPTCYSRAHGHASGGGPWRVEAVSRQLRSLLAAGRRSDPEFSVSEGTPGEISIPNLAVFPSRDHAELPPGIDTANFRAPWDVQVIPVFAYLYHSYVMGYTAWAGEWAGDAPIPSGGG